MTDYALSTNELYGLALTDAPLGKYFGGVFVADKTPIHIESYPKAFIVNTDPSDKPGEHWLGVWFNNEESVEFYDSYAMPPHYYSKDIQQFVRRPILQDIPWALQEYDSSTCGDYALYFLMMRAKGYYIPTIMKQFKRHDYVNNDLKVVRHIKTFIKRKLFRSVAQGQNVKTRRENLRNREPPLWMKMTHPELYK